MFLIISYRMIDTRSGIIDYHGKYINLLTESILVPIGQSKVVGSDTSR